MKPEKKPTESDPPTVPGVENPFKAETKQYDAPPKFDPETATGDEEVFDPETLVAPRRWSLRDDSGVQFQPATRAQAPTESSDRAAKKPDPSGVFAPPTQQYGGPAEPTRAPPVEPAAPALANDAVAASDDPLAGTPYRTIGHLGVGGMGDVYAAEDTEVGEPVVVKLLRPDVDESAAERLRREANALALLRHPNIVEVSRLSQTPKGRWYIAMERLYGDT